MKKEFILWALREAGIKDYKIANSDIAITCPFAKWTHAKGTDRHPSFGISFGDGVSLYNCFTCKRTGVFSDMFLSLYNFSRDDKYMPIYRKVKEEELDPSNILGIDADPDKLPEPLSEALFSDFYDEIQDHHDAFSYIQKRGISQNTIQKLGLKYDIKQSRILFPVRGVDKLLYGFTGRSIDDNIRPKVRDYFGLPKRHLLLGAHNFTPEKPVLVVEGLFAYAHLHEIKADMYFNIVALLGSALTEEKANILKSWNKPVYLMLDNDDAGDLGIYGGVDKHGMRIKGALNQLKDTVPVFIPAWPQDKLDPDELTINEINIIFQETMPYGVLTAL